MSTMSQPPSPRRRRSSSPRPGGALAHRHPARRARRLLLHRRRPGHDLGVRPQHGHPRVRPRRPALPRLPLPLRWRRSSSAGASSPELSPGLLAFVFARIFAEPVINAAIAYESGRDAAQNAAEQGDRAAARPRRARTSSAVRSRPTSASASASWCSARPWVRCSPSSTPSASAGSAGCGRACWRCCSPAPVSSPSTSCRSSSTPPTRPRSGTRRRSGNEAGSTSSWSGPPSSSWCWRCCWARPWRNGSATGTPAWPPAPRTSW